MTTNKNGDFFKIGIPFTMFTYVYRRGKMKESNDRTGEFLALLFRQKDINRWGLMRNVYQESLSEHCYEVALISHILALIGNKMFSKDYDVNRITSASLYHDMSEILTGDLPTPVKYYNEEIKVAYKKIERTAENIILGLLPDGLDKEYKHLLTLNEDEKAIVKSADKICAYIKCVSELTAGNKEFVAAERSIRAQLDSLVLPEAKYFADNYLDSFTKPLDDITLGEHNEKSSNI